MFFLFCQPGLNDKNTIDFLIRDLIIKSLKLKKKNIIDINSFKKNKFFLTVNKRNKIFESIVKILSALDFFFKMKNILEKKNIKNILFDSYTIFDLFFFSFLKIDKTCNVIIYLRIPYSYIPFMKYLFCFSIMLLKKKKVQFITDTEILKKHFKDDYNIKCEVMPIPSKIKIKTKLKKFTLKRINILFPGKSRDEKGISNVLKIFKSEIKNTYINFFFLKNHKIIDNLNNRKNLKLQSIDQNLSYKDYIKSLCSYDVILLPYDHKTYKLRSSGIFIDLIKLNKIFLVSDSTWMSKTLRKYNVNILIIKDWNIESILSKLKKINNNFSDFKKDYLKMREKIIKKNSNLEFDKKIKKIFINNLTSL